MTNGYNANFWRTSESVVDSVAATAASDLTLDSVALPRDALGRIVTRTEVSLGTSRVSGYTYDIEGRLTDVTVGGITTEHYEYDANGNRLRGLTTQDGVTTDRTGTYDAQDRLTSYGPLSYAYTANGEVQTKTNTNTNEVTGYSYDAFGNLRSVELPNGTSLEYLVDGENRRVAKMVDGTITKRWLWSSQLRVAAELGASGALAKRFIYGEGANSPELMVTYSGGVVSKVYRIITDQLGSPVLVVNTANAADVLLRALYDSWGNRTVIEGDADAVPFGFAGGLLDVDTGLVRFGARDYDPEIGRWVSKDAIRFEGNQANLYVYVWNDPVNYVDRDGEKPTDIFKAMPLVKTLYCSYQLWRLGDAAEECIAEERERTAKATCLEDFIEQSTGSGYPSDAYLACLQRKDPGRIAQTIAVCGSAVLGSALDRGGIVPR